VRSGPGGRGPGRRQILVAWRRPVADRGARGHHHSGAFGAVRFRRGVRGERGHLAERARLLHQAPVTAHPERRSRGWWRRWRRHGVQDNVGALSVQGVRARVRGTAATQVGRRNRSTRQRRGSRPGDRV